MLVSGVLCLRVSHRGTMCPVNVPRPTEELPRRAIEWRRLMTLSGVFFRRRPSRRTPSAPLVGRRTGLQHRMLVLTAALALAMPNRGWSGRMQSARATTRRPRVVGPMTEPLCDADISVSCTWSVLDGACLPSTNCRSYNRCGLFTCECKPMRSTALKPWEVLQLNFSSALDTAAIHRAFNARARTLAPEHANTVIEPG